MDSFLSLFDPGLSDKPAKSRPGWEENGNSLTLSPVDGCPEFPPEPQFGNVEYKLKLISPSQSRFEHLVTQMKWRLREGHGEAIYEIGIEDSGAVRGLCREEMTETLSILSQLAKKLNATTKITREAVVPESTDSDGEERTVAEVLIKKIPEDQPEDVRVCALGNYDAGKSSLLGVLTQGELDDGSGRARLNMFRHLHEIQSGRTSSISHEVIGFDSKGRAINYQEGNPETIAEMSVKLVTLIDLAGHQKYLRTTLRGVIGYSPHYLLFVMSGVTGFTTLTKEHLALAIALQIPMIIVVTKIDIAQPPKLQTALADLKNYLTNEECNRVAHIIESDEDVDAVALTQPSETDYPIICVSCLTGEGLPLLKRLLYLLPAGLNVNEQERLEQEAPEFQIDETFRIPNSKTILGGLVVTGVVKEGTPLLIGPLTNGMFQHVKVASIRRNKVPCPLVRARQSASVGLDVEVEGLRRGMVLVSPKSCPKACIYFQATIRILYHKTVICKGFESTVHVGNVLQTACIEEIKPQPQLITNEIGSVIFRFIRVPEYVKIGARVVLRNGLTRGIGHVTRVFPLNSSTLSISN